MKFWKCELCRVNIKVPNDYEEEYCCDGYMCGCYGAPINPALCDKCEIKAFGEPVKEELI